MFFDYVNSQEFSNAENAHNTFFSKLNYSGDFEEIRKPGKLLLWLENNITITNFANISEAKTELNNLIHLETIKEDTFNTLFTFIKTAPIDQVVSRFNKWIYINNLETTFDTKDCNKDFKKCQDEISTQYQLEIRTNYASDCSESEISIANSVSKQNYQDGMNACKDSWNACRNPKK